MGIESRIKNISEYKSQLAERFKDRGYEVNYKQDCFPQIEIRCGGGKELKELPLYGQIRFEEEKGEFSINKGLVSKLTLFLIPNQKNLPKSLYQFDRGRESGKVANPEGLKSFPVADKMYKDIVDVVKPELESLKQTSNFSASETRVVKLPDMHEDKESNKPGQILNDNYDDTGFDLGLFNTTPVSKDGGEFDLNLG